MTMPEHRIGPASSQAAQPTPSKRGRASIQPPPPKVRMRVQVRMHACARGACVLPHTSGGGITRRTDRPLQVLLYRVGGIGEGGGGGSRRAGAGVPCLHLLGDMWQRHAGLGIAPAAQRAAKACWAGHWPCCSTCGKGMLDWALHLLLSVGQRHAGLGIGPAAQRAAKALLGWALHLMGALKCVCVCVMCVCVCVEGGRRLWLCTSWERLGMQHGRCTLMHARALHPPRCEAPFSKESKIISGKLNSSSSSPKQCPRPSWFTCRAWHLCQGSSSSSSSSRGSSSRGSSGRRSRGSSSRGSSGRRSNRRSRGSSRRSSSRRVWGARRMGSGEGPTLRQSTQRLSQGRKVGYMCGCFLVYGELDISREGGKRSQKHRAAASVRARCTLVLLPHAHGWRSTLLTSIRLPTSMHMRLLPS